MTDHDASSLFYPYTRARTRKRPIGDDASSSVMRHATADDDLRAAQTEVASCTAAGARFRLNAQSPDWVGIPIARALKLDPTDKAHRSKVSRMLKVWIETGVFTVVEGKDEKRRLREFVEVGEHASNAGE